MKNRAPTGPLKSRTQIQSTAEGRALLAKTPTTTLHSYAKMLKKEVSDARSKGDSAALAGANAELANVTRTLANRSDD